MLKPKLRSNTIKLNVSHCECEFEKGECEFEKGECEFEKGNIILPISIRPIDDEILVSTKRVKMNCRTSVRGH